MEKYGPALVIVGALLVAGLFAMDRYDSNFDPTGRKEAQSEYNRKQALQYLEEISADRDKRLKQLLAE